MSTTYFERNPQQLTQWRRQRRNGADTAPQVGLHTYQAGWTAARGAEYLTERNDPGSYHGLAGLDQAIQLAPWDAETWHAIFLNNWSVGISAMWFAGRWAELSDKDRTTLINRMAWLAHQFSRWCVATGRGRVLPRKLTRAQALNRESGFFYHGDTQDDRSDPGADFPLAQFLAEFNRLEGNTPPKPVAPFASPKPVSGSTKPWPAGRAAWPDAYLTRQRSHNAFQDKALSELLRRAGYRQGTLARQLQTRLKASGDYTGAITWVSVIGPQTIRAWQSFLSKRTNPKTGRRFYTGAIDGKRGPLTVLATIDFLNWQADVIHGKA